MTLGNDMALMMGADFFRALPVACLRLLAFGAETLALKPGEILYQKGDPATSAYIVLKGRVLLFHQYGKERVNGPELGRGVLFDELALISLEKRLTGAMALDEVSLLVVERRIFQKILQEYPETIPLVHRKVAESIEKISCQIEKALLLFEGQPLKETMTGT